MSTRLRTLAATATVLALLLAAALAAPARADTAPAPGDVTRSLSFTAPDGTVLHATVAGTGSLAARPLVVEDSPYAPDVTSLDWVGSAYNRVELQWRGTGLSGGSLDATGSADQHDLSAFLGWACHQSWSSGETGLYGFSASAIVVYNAMHLPLPCVKAASLGAGTVDLYRDLLDIGGIPNLAPDGFVLAAIGAASLAAGPERLATTPTSVPAAVAGYLGTSLSVLGNPTEDAYWNERTFQGDADHIPVLAGTGFTDVEEGGPPQAFVATRRYGSHLLVFGAHDGSPAGLPGPVPQYRNWLDHHLLGVPLSAANQPQVSAYLSNGSRQAFLAGQVTHLTSTTWPLAGTRWTGLSLSSARSGTASSLNDGSLTLHPQATRSAVSYPFLPSEPTETDLHTAAAIGPTLDQLAALVPALDNMSLTEPTSLTWTTPPLAHPVDAVGPGALDVDLSSTAPVTDIYAVVADVHPDGTADPVATGSLRTAFPDIVASRSMTDGNGTVVAPYANFSSAHPAPPLATRRYQVDLLPIGNRFAAGDRLRLYLVGTPLTQLGALPGINTVTQGGPTLSRLILPSVGAGFDFTGTAR